MNRVLRNNYLIFLSRLILGVVFIYAALGKIGNPWQFVISIENYQILSPLYSHYVAIILPWLELVCGAALIMGAAVSGSAFLASAMLTVFILAIASALIRGLDIECGCFSLEDTGTKLSWLKIVEDTVLLSLSLHILSYYKPFLSLQEKLKKP